MCIHTRALSTRRKDICHPDFAFHFSREVAMLATHFAERMLLMASPVVLGSAIYTYAPAEESGHGRSWKAFFACFFSQCYFSGYRAVRSFQI